MLIYLFLFFTQQCSATQPAANLHLIVKYPAISYEHMVLWPAVDLFPGAAATCPVVWYFASISLRLEPSGQSNVSSYMHSWVSACSALSVHLYVRYTLLQRRRTDRPSLKQRQTCRDMGIDIQQSHMKMCFHTQSEKQTQETPNKLKAIRSWHSLFILIPSSILERWSKEVITLTSSLRGFC